RWHRAVDSLHARRPAQATARALLRRLPLLREGTEILTLTRTNDMQTATMESMNPASQRYAKCIAASKRIRWDIDRDVIRGRGLKFARKFLRDGLSRVTELAFLRANEMRFMSQIQGRSYANIFGLVERFIGAKTLEISKDHWLGDQMALEAL